MVCATHDMHCSIVILSNADWTRLLERMEGFSNTNDHLHTGCLGFFGSTQLVILIRTLIMSVDNYNTDEP